MEVEEAESQEAQAVSIWSSIPGNDPVVYDSDEGENIESNGCFDVATAYGNLVRLMVQDNEGSAAIVLTPEGLAELHRRIIIARDYSRRQ